MSLFKEIVKSVLLEDVQISKVNDAIVNTYEVKINYKSETDSASGERIIQPVAYGVSKGGNLLLRAYQPFGDTQSSVPSWKLFSISGIQKWKPLRDRIFDMPNGFNTNGDKKMSIVYSIANFNKKNNDKNIVKTIDNKPESTNNASLMNNFKRNIETNKKNIDFVQNNPYIFNKQNSNDSHMTVSSGPVKKDDIVNNDNDVSSDNENNINKKL